MDRVYNFSPGPSQLALPVLEKAQKELLCYGSTGMSVMEMSHRSKMYTDIYDQTVADLKELMAIPEDYEVVFLQGGATQQFSAIPLNLMVHKKADYIDSGNFAHLAAEEGKRYGEVHVVASSREDNYTYVPDVKDIAFTDGADYLHITQNNTIYGTRYVELPESAAPLATPSQSTPVTPIALVPMRATAVCAMVRTARTPAARQNSLVMVPPPRSPCLVGRQSFVGRSR